MTTRLRSALFVPGSKEHQIEKALGLGADGVVIDLEDAVATAEKADARANVIRWSEHPRECRLYVRVNSLGTPFALRDLEAMTLPGIDGIVLPMAENACDVRIADWALSKLEEERDLEVGRIELLPIVETATAIANAREIVGASSRIERAAFGAGDFCADLGMEWVTANPALVAARFDLVVACRDNGVQPPIDTAFTEVRDSDAYVVEAKLARQMGFGGKFCIHPGQVEHANRVFSPSPEEVAQARRVWEAFVESEAKGIAALVVDDKFVDYPVAKQARETLERAGEAVASPDEVTR
jgi:citrate lyase subunit beta / citryl-CoA lyase